MPRHEKRAGDILGHGLLQPPWNWGWWGRRGGCFRPPALGGWRGGGLVWGPQQTRRDTCRPLQAWSFVGQLCMCSKWALPARRHWGAHFMVSPLRVCVCGGGIDQAHVRQLHCLRKKERAMCKWTHTTLPNAVNVLCQALPTCCPGTHSSRRAGTPLAYGAMGVRHMSQTIPERPQSRSG